MIGGQKRTPKKVVTWDEVLENSGGGFDIFYRELGQVVREKCFNHPLREDQKPSAGLHKENDVYFLIDFAGRLTPKTALQYTMERYGLSFRDAVAKMAGDLGLSPDDNQYERQQKRVFASEEGEEKPLVMNFTYQTWKKHHWDFWENTEVTDKHCEHYKTYAVKDISIDRQKFPIGYNEVVWAYYIPELHKMKFYFPEREREKKFRNNAPNTHLWNAKDIYSWSKIRIQKSMKDLLVSTVIDPHCIATQNESSKILLENNYDRLAASPGEKIMCYGSDFQGFHESLIVTQLTGWKWFNTPNKDLPEINDEYGYAKKYGIRELEKLYELKNII